MKVVVCIKAVPEGVSSIRLIESNGTIGCEYLRLFTNECDEYALEEALTLKRQHGAEIAVLSIGGIRCQDILYMALAKGADSATRIDADFTDAQITAEIIAEAMKTMSYDLVLTGVEAADTMSAQVGVSVAEILGLPHVFAVTKVEVQPEERSIRVVKELGGGTSERLEVDLPALLCVQSGIQPLTYASLPKVMRARQQPMGCLQLADLGLSLEELDGRRLKIIRVFDPPRAEYAEIIEGTPTEVAGLLMERMKNSLG